MIPVALLRRTALLACLGLPALRGAARPAEGDDGATPAGAAARLHALLIGCTEYPRIQARVSPEVYAARVRLAGSANDVELMRRTLTERFGVPADRVRSLAGWPADAAARPTRDNVLRELGALADRSYAAGERVLVHYSGHGVQQLDQPGADGDELDGLDEAWLLADGDRDDRGGYAGTLRDDELGALLGRIQARGARVWCVMDCCHSATGLRAAEALPGPLRTLDPSLLGVDLCPAATWREGGARERRPGGGGRDGAAGMVAFYAAQSDQEVPEVRVPPGSGTAYGLLTATLARALVRSGDRLTYSELYERVAIGYREQGVAHDVQPLAEGDLDQPVFDAQGRAAPALYVRRRAASALELSGGELHGITRGTELEVFAPGRAGEAGGLLGRVAVRDLRPEIARVEPLGAAGWVGGDAAVWPARIVRHALGESSVPLALEDARGRRLAPAALGPALRALLEGEAVRTRHPLREPSQRAPWTLRVDEAGLPRSLRGPLGAAFRVDLGSLEEALARVHRGEGLLRLATRAPELVPPPYLEVRVEIPEEPPDRRRLKPGRAIAPWTHLQVRLVKRAPQDPAEDIDLHVLWLDAHLGVKLLFPPNGHAPRLAAADVTPAQGRLLADVWPSDAGQGEERLLAIAVRQRAGVPHLDLAWLEQPPLQVLRAAGDDEVTRLFAELADGGPVAALRGDGVRVDGDALRLGVATLSWHTRWSPLRAPAARADDVRAPVALGPAPPPDPASPPPPARLGPFVRLTRAGPAPGAACLLVEEGDPRVQHVLLDLDGEAPPGARTPQGLSAWAQAGAAGADLELRREGRRSTAWYDTDRDAAPDLVLVDADGDGVAEERFELARTPAGPLGAWRRLDPEGAWVLSTAHVKWLNDGHDDEGERERAYERLHAVAANGAGDPP